MKTPLNRIEQNFIFENFIKDTPELIIINAPRVFKVLPSDYSIENNFIVFKIPHAMVADGRCQIIFEHRKRAMSIFVDLVFRGSLCEFEFPKNVFKYNYTDVKTEIDARFSFSENHEVRVNEVEKFPLDSFFDDLLIANLNENILKNIRLMLLKQKRETNEVAVYRIYNFLLQYSKQYNEQKDGLGFPNNSLVFIDDKMVVVFVKKVTADLFMSQDDFDITIRFPGRSISIERSYLVGCIGLKKKHAILTFSCEKARPEDKRFMSERVYKLKYGRKNTKL